MNYRADIDGLRAVAVLAVIANHLPQNYFPSGYLGVDVFFVISGFVITASLFSQTASSLTELYKEFFARRVKRLLPALFVCVGISSIYVFMNDPYPGESLKTGISSLFGLSNIVLYDAELDYFAASSKYNAFTHTWSLGVEEQFYLFFPLVVWLGFFKWGDGNKAKNLTWILLVSSVLSLLAFVYLYEVNQPAAYFLTPMRIWELGAGALAYIFMGSNFYRQLKQGLGKISLLLLLLLVAAFFASSEYAVIATVASIFITFWILLCPKEALANRFLSTPPAVFIGRISYSLYLWHWPVITQDAFGLSAHSDSPLVYLLLIAGLSVASFYIVEKPLRQKKWAARKRHEVGLGFAFSVVLAVVVLGGLKFYESKKYPPRFLPLLSSAKSYNPTCVIDGEKRLLTSTMFEDCTVRPKQTASPMIWVMGDSHAGHLQGMLYEMYDQIGTGVHLITTPGMPYPVVITRPSYPEADAVLFNSREIIYQKAYKDINSGDIVLIPRLYFSPNLPGNPVVRNVNAWLNKVPNLAQSLSNKGAQLILFGPLPFFDTIDDIKICSLEDRQACAANREQQVRKNKAVLERLRKLSQAHDNVHLFDPFQALCPEVELWCYPDENDVFLFHDKSHLNSLGSKALAEPFTDFLIDEGLLDSQEAGSAQVIFNPANTPDQ